MAKFIKTIHDRVNFAIKKGLTGYIPPSKIDDEVHAESMNTWRHYVGLFEKTRLMDVCLRPFQNTESVALTNGAGTYVTKDFVYSLEGVPNPQIFSGTGPLGITNYALTNTLFKYGSSYYINLATASGTATVKVEIDGVVLFNGSVTSGGVNVSFVYRGNLNIKFTVSVVALTVLTINEGVPGGTLENIEIKDISDESFNYRVNHPVKVPTKVYPIANRLNQSIIVRPASAFTTVKIGYLKRPIRPVYAYTTVGDRYIYDDTNSVDFEWNETVHDIIMEKALANMGINMRSQEMIQFSNQQQQIEKQP